MMPARIERAPLPCLRGSLREKPGTAILAANSLHSLRYNSRLERQQPNPDRHSLPRSHAARLPLQRLAGESFASASGLQCFCNGQPPPKSPIVDRERPCYTVKLRSWLQTTMTASPGISDRLPVSPVKQMASQSTAPASQPCPASRLTRPGPGRPVAVPARRICIV